MSDGKWSEEKCQKEWKKDIVSQLGGPEMVVELSDEQIHFAIDSAIRWEVERKQYEDITPTFPQVREYAIAMATMILGRIRGKFTDIILPTGRVGMDGAALREDARFRFLSLGCGPYGGPRVD